MGGESEDVLTAKPTVSCEANGQTAGTYDIIVSGAAADNYEITHVNGTLTVADHQHAWTYTAKDDTITATCNAEGCLNKTATIQLNAPENLTYDGTAKIVTVTQSPAGIFTDVPAVEYVGDCRSTGSHTAKLTYGNVTAQLTFTITCDHSFEAGEYRWNENHTACTVTGTCTAGCGATAEAKATVTSSQTKAPTCEDKGETTYTATFTEDWAENQIKTVADIPAKDHDWSVTYQWSEDGKTCTAIHVCGNDEAHNETEIAAASGMVKTPATCVEMGWTTYTANFNAEWAVDGQTRDVQDLPLADHIPGAPVEENRVESTCTVAGSYDEVVYCSVCKTHEIRREKKELALADHTPGAPVEENRVESTCTVAGSYDEVVYCSVCKTHEISRVKKELALADHTPGAPVEENRKESTCTEAGSYDEVVYCSVCKTHEISRETKTLALADHTEEAVKGYDPTCTESGLTDGIKCGICGEVLTQQEEISALGHTVVMQESEAPSCDLNGYEYYACERCGGQEHTILLEATGHDYENGKCTKCGEKDPNATKPNKPGYGFIWDWIFGGWWGDCCKHSYTSVVTAPTCTEKGYTTHTCSECGDSYKDSYTRALGHTWDDGVVTKEPACTEKGEKSYTCSVCGAKKTESIKAIGHKFEDGVCTECGEEEASKPTGPSKPDKPCKPGWGNIWDLIFKWWK